MQGSGPNRCVRVTMNKDLTLGAHQKLASEALRWLCLYGIVAHAVVIHTVVF